MVFGEIVEPSTRALILDDELDELPEYSQPSYEWEGDLQTPTNLGNLIFIDSSKVIQTCSKTLKSSIPVARLVNEGLSIYKFQSNYLAVFNGQCKNLVIGEIVELLSAWIAKAKAVYAITSSLISTFQPVENLPSSSAITFTRCLTNMEQVPYNFCKRLEPPNLIQSFGASVLTYCIHNNIKASLWVVYTDNMPIDSVNSSEILRLFRILGLDDIKVEFGVKAVSSNLYM